jgi:hypothetical protein
MSPRHDSPCRAGAFKLRSDVPPANLTVRLATLDDTAEIAAMSRDLIESGLGWTWTVARVARNIRNPSTLTVAACVPERIAGSPTAATSTHLSPRGCGSGRRHRRLAESALAAASPPSPELRETNRPPAALRAARFASCARAGLLRRRRDGGAHVARHPPRPTGPVPGIGRLLSG